MPSPAAVLVLDNDTPRQRGSPGAGRLAVLVGELDAHDDAVVLEDLAELAELDLLVESGQVLGHRFEPVRVAPAWRGKSRKKSPRAAG